ncbi:MAG: hypothetical protein Ct9H300mP21_11160 [Pseudomonadota bacterium]|nr:MAG: hypothetical protein Ct9H300mP21_11160 [Pseudomonadota bacterium]
MLTFPDIFACFWSFTRIKCPTCPMLKFHCFLQTAGGKLRNQFLIRLRILKFFRNFYFKTVVTSKIIITCFFFQELKEAAIIPYSFDVLCGGVLIPSHNFRFLPNLNFAGGFSALSISLNSCHNNSVFPNLVFNSL